MSLKLKLRKFRREVLIGLSKLGLRSAVISRGSSRFQIPLIYGIGRFHFVPAPEPWMDKALKAVMTCSEGAIVDVGVNIGQFLLKVKEQDPVREYYGFEPNPPCIFYLYELIRLNKFQHTYILPLAASIETKSNFLYSEAWDSGTSTLVKDNAREETAFSTTIFSMVGDDIMLSLNTDKLAYIKIDVEGFEYEVLKGLRATLESKRPIVFCEIWHEKLIDEGDQPSAFIANIHTYLDELEYIAIGAKKDLGIYIIRDAADYQGAHFADYLFAPKEKVEELRKVL